MKTKFIPLLVAALLMAGSAALTAKTETTRQAKPRIEVCFVLDTTGSMGGLIEGAKQKIWSISNTMINTTPVPELKIGLVGYRDRGDAYVVKSFPLTDDIDEIYGKLRGFQADGGGDTPESVNEALAEAVNKMPWSADSDVLKIIFLVGDAPPHMDYQDGRKYPDICRNAAKKDIIINTVQCGSIADTAPIWKKIAQLAEGSYAAIPQDGNVAVIATPMDEKLAVLNKKIGQTLIPYGTTGVRLAVHAKQAYAEAASAPAAADRLSYNSLSGKTVQGTGELLDALKDGSVKMDDIKPTNLPEDLRGLDKAELKSRIEQKQKERAEIQKQIETLARERNDYIEAEIKKTAVTGKGDSFDKNVSDTIRTEAAKKGIYYAP